MKKKIVGWAVVSKETDEITGIYMTRRIARYSAKNNYTFVWDFVPAPCKVEKVTIIRDK